MDDLYEPIDRLWMETDLPKEILKTPGWEGGWRLLFYWYFTRATFPEPPYERPPCDPSGQPATWAQRIHIWSHQLVFGYGDGPLHAEIQGQAQRLVLDWWKGEGTTWRSLKQRRLTSDDPIRNRTAEGTMKAPERKLGKDI